MGAIVTLLVFSLMLTGGVRKLNRRAALVAVVVFFIVFFGVITQIQGSFIPTSQDIQDISLMLFNQYVVPFELLSVVLVSGIIGMLYITRRDE